VTDAVRFSSHLLQFLLLLPFCSPLLLLYFFFLGFLVMIFRFFVVMLTLFRFLLTLSDSLCSCCVFGDPILVSFLGGVIFLCPFFVILVHAFLPDQRFTLFLVWKPSKFVFCVFWSFSCCILRSVTLLEYKRCRRFVVSVALIVTLLVIVRY